MWQQRILIFIMSILTFQPHAGSAQETDWNWDKCKEERVPNSRDIYKEQLHPLAAARAAGGGAFRVACRGDGITTIYLSPTQQLEEDYGTFFGIDIYNKEKKASLYIRESDSFERTRENIYFDTEILSYARDARVTISISGSTLEVRFNNATTPLNVRDYKVEQIKYIGFDSSLNSQGSATFKYGC